MDKLELDAKLIDEILSYLGKRPYDEVYMIISKIFATAEEHKNKNDKGNK